MHGNILQKFSGFSLIPDPVRGIFDVFGINSDYEFSDGKEGNSLIRGLMSQSNKNNINLICTDNIDIDQINSLSNLDSEKIKIISDVSEIKKDDLNLIFVRFNFTKLKDLRNLKIMIDLNKKVISGLLIKV